MRTPPVGEGAGVGPVRWTVLSPAHLLSDSPNDSSLVLMVETRGIRVLLTGDVEPPSQEVLEREGLGPVDVLKVPHHGSRYQDPALLTGLGARLALVSVGEDNDYGHPAAETLALLQHAGMVVRRTDHDGDIAVVVGPGAETSVWSAAGDRRPPVAGCGHASPPGSSGTQHPLGAVTLVTGPEELLNDRIVQAARAAVLRSDPEAEVHETAGEQVDRGSLGELSAPSLFSSTRFVVVRRLEDVPEEVHEGLVAYAGAPDPDVALVLVHSGGPRGSGLLGKLRKLPSVSEHKSEAVKGQGFVQFTVTEARHHRARLDHDAAAALVESVGADLRALASAVDQLAHDFPDRELDLELVRTYFSGPCRREGLRDRRARPQRAHRPGSRGAPVGPRHGGGGSRRHGFVRLGRPRSGALQGRPPRAA